MFSIHDLYQQKHYHACEKLCREQIKSDKRNLDSHKYLIRSLEGLGDISAALKACDLALKQFKKPQDKAELLHLKAVILVKDNRLEAAAQSYEACLLKDPERAATWFLQASCLFELNRFGECEKSVVEMLKRAANLPASAIGRGLYLLAQSRRSLTATALFKRFPQAESHIAVPYYHFALAELYEREQNYARALRHFDEGNRLVKEKSGYSIKDDMDTVGFYTSLSVENTVAVAVDESAPIPIFILGMPRTGSSLLEQMLGRHSSVLPMGELDWLPQAVERTIQSLPPPRNRNQVRAACADNQFLESIRDGYMESLPKINERFFIDKLPGNFLYTGLIPEVFPGALMIHTRRDKIATIWSCYRTPFVDGQGFSHDLGDASLYFDAVDRATESAGKQAPEHYLSVSYEELIANPKLNLSLILERLKLPFEAACLEHEKTERMVSTASRYQVTQPVYQGANEGWKAYESMLSGRI